MEFNVFNFGSVPSKIDKKVFMDTILGTSFFLCHDLKRGNTLLITEANNVDLKLNGSLPGLNLIPYSGFSLIKGKGICISSFAKYPQKVQHEDTYLENTDLFRDMYKIFRGSDLQIFFLFVPKNIKDVKRFKEDIEDRISKMDIRINRNHGNRITGFSESVQRDLYYGSDERKNFALLLSSLDEAMANNGISFAVNIIISGEIPNSHIREYIKSKIFAIREKEIWIDNMEKLYKEAEHADAFPMSLSDATCMITVSSSTDIENTIETTCPKSSGSINIGEYLESGAGKSGMLLNTGADAFNLGSIITGLPGTGKTATAMRLIDELNEKEGSNSIIISPTTEWDEFGREHGMQVIDLYETDANINFFKCDADIGISKFYENLAMLLSSASNAGPYTNAIEKSLLSAFQKVYEKGEKVDPDEIYSYVEFAVIEQHAKRTNVGVTYTKHGENIMAALQLLRLMLSKPQFAYKEGINFRDLLTTGVVFNLSKVSNNMKPFFYALILNQFYGFADEFDEKGNDKLRMLICIEEAQLVFGNEEISAATKDLKQRIQDFRKKGIGLMLITHSVTDISIGLRRLCQIKMYFRQSSDTAKYAYNDLAFKTSEDKEVIWKLKNLKQGTCALSYLSTEYGSRVQHNTVFASAKAYYPKNNTHYDKPSVKRDRRIENMAVLIKNSNNEPVTVRLRILRLGETVWEGTTDEQGGIIVKNTLLNKQYVVKVLGEKKKNTKTFKAAGGRENVITL